MNTFYMCFVHARWLKHLQWTQNGFLCGVGSYQQATHQMKLLAAVPNIIKFVYKG